jgi:hypothetical protein
MSTTTKPKRSKTKAARPAKPNIKAAKPRRAKQAAKPVAYTSEDAEVIGMPAADQACESTTTATKALSGLDAAAQILREVGEPLNAQDMVRHMLETGLWKTAGKTPASTIYAAIIRDIKAKGSGSRFQKVDRGRFAIAG